MFIPGMLPIGFLFAGLVFAGVFFLLDAALRRCIADIFIPGIFIPGISDMSCFFAVCFFRAVFLFFRDVAFDLDFGLLIPGISDMSCWAGTETLANNRNVAGRSAHTLTRVKSHVLAFFITTPSQRFPQGQRSHLGERLLQFQIRFGCLGNGRTRVSVSMDETLERG